MLIDYSISHLKKNIFENVVYETTVILLRCQYEMAFGCDNMHGDFGITNGLLEAFGSLV